MKQFVYWVGTILSLILGLIGVGLYLIAINDPKNNLGIWPLILGILFFVQGILYLLFSIRKLRINRASDVSQFLFFFGIAFSVFIVLSLAYRILPFKANSPISEITNMLYIMIGISIGIFSLGFILIIIGAIKGRGSVSNIVGYEESKKTKSPLLIILVVIFVLFIVISSYFIIKIFVHPPTSSNCRPFYELKQTKKTGVFYRQLHKGMDCRNASLILNIQFCFSEDTEEFKYCKTLGDIETYQSKKLVCSRANSFLLFRSSCEEISLCKSTGCKYDENNNICCANYFLNQKSKIDNSKLIYENGLNLIS